MRIRFRLPIACALLTVAAAAQAGDGAPPCTPAWIPTFGPEPGTNLDVLATTVFDDGDGLALYAGGAFTTAGGVPVNRVAKWDGSTWTRLRQGMDDRVLALAGFDDGRGGGPALYAAGEFLKASGVVATHIAKWDGLNWSPLGSGVGAPVEDFMWINALAAFDDGSGGGPALYAGGRFTTAGGAPARNVAKWDGSTWSPLGAGTDSDVLAMAVFDDGNGGGPALFVAGDFTSAGPVAARGVAKWNGTSWSVLGSGITGGASPSVKALTVLDDGSGADPVLCAAGNFTIAGGVAAKGAARWDGVHWMALGTGLGGPLTATAYALATFDDGLGAGPALYAGGYVLPGDGSVQGRVSRWDGSTWTPAGSGMTGGTARVFTLAAFDAGTGGGPALYAGGEFGLASGVPALNIAHWDGASWSSLGAGLNAGVYALAALDEGGGSTDLYAGGQFDTGSGAALEHIGRWDGSGWLPVGSGVNGAVRALCAHDSGAGPALYAGGEFTTAGGATVNHIARWDGASWSALGTGLPSSGNTLRALLSFDDLRGGGPVLCAGGKFTSISGLNALDVARWDGAAWAPFGNGLSGEVLSLVSFDDGGGAGPLLIAGGRITQSGGVPLKLIAAWDGASWSALGGGISSMGLPNGNYVSALAVFDDGLGGGPALYAGGAFNLADGLPANFIAKWNGVSWSALGSGLSGGLPDYGTFVNALAVHDDGTGSALYVGGEFSLAGGVPASRIAKWDGVAWSAVGSGMGFVLSPHVHALLPFEDGSGPALIAGGQFSSAIDSGDSYIARWGCPGAPSAWNDLGQALAGTGGLPHLAGTGPLVAASPVQLALSSAKPFAPSTLVIGVSAVAAPFKGGVLVPHPDLLLGLATDVLGQAGFGGLWPAGVPSNFTTYFQWWIQDPAGPQEYAASNAVAGTAP